MGLSDVYNKLRGISASSNATLLGQHTVLQNQQLIDFYAQQALSQQAHYFTTNPTSTVTGYYQPYNAARAAAGIDFDFPISPEKKKDKEKEMLVNILKSKL